MSLPLPKEGTGLNTIAFDLDGTLAEATWPSPHIGEPIERGIAALLEYRRKGFEIIIFTSRPASHLERIRHWLRDQALDFDVYDIVTDKPRAAMYVDDRAVAFPEAFESASDLAAVMEVIERDMFAERAPHPKDTDPRAHYFHKTAGVHHFSDYCGKYACERMPE